MNETTPTAPVTETSVAQPIERRRIIRLEASNFKRLHAVEIIPSGSTVVLSGSNGAGKSSILDSIEAALAGKDHIDAVPIRIGEHKARIVVDLGDIVVERTFTAGGGTSLVVRSKETGEPLRSPQAILDALCGSSLMFDPLSFTLMKPADQLETLRKLVGIDFNALNAQRQSLYDNRTAVNRDLGVANGNLGQLPEEPGVPEEETSVASLLERQTAIREANKGIDQATELLGIDQGLLHNIDENIVEINAEMLSLQTRLDMKKVELAKEEVNKAAQAKVVELKTAALGAMTRQDESAVNELIKNSDLTNAAVRRQQKRRNLLTSRDALTKRTQDLTAEIDKVDAMKEKLLKEASFPMPGLSFGDTGVLLNGVPFEQGSQAQKLKAAVAIGIALNPKVRVILVRDAAICDEESLKVLNEMATDFDCQVWLEDCRSKDPARIEIADGSVVEKT